MDLEFPGLSNHLVLGRSKLIHLYGRDNSQILAQELLYRAGDLIPINVKFDLGTSVYIKALKNTSAERLPGYRLLSSREEKRVYNSI